jgi:hypothetical protein
MTVAWKLRPAAKIQGDFLPETRHLQSLPDTAQRFSKSRQTLQDFHQPLHGLIRRLKKFLQRLPDYAETATMPAARLVAFSHFRLSTLNF